MSLACDLYFSKSFNIIHGNDNPQLNCGHK